VIGRMPKPADDSPRIFKVPFTPGTITAVALDKGKVVATHEMTTAGPAARLVVKSDRTSVTTDSDDVAHVTVEVVDAKAVIVPAASNEITFSVEGPAAIIALDNGDPASHESYQGVKRSAFRSRALAIVRATAATGRITITARAEGLAAGSVSFEAGTQSR
jgi:beta-galactosidase